MEESKDLVVFTIPRLREPIGHRLRAEKGSHAVLIVPRKVIVQGEDFKMVLSRIASLVQCFHSLDEV